MLNWFGDWSNGALYQVGREFTNKIDLEKANVSDQCFKATLWPYMACASNQQFQIEFHNTNVYQSIHKFCFDQFDLSCIVLLDLYLDNPEIWTINEVCLFKH